MEIPATKDCSPNSGGDPDGSLQMSHMDGNTSVISDLGTTNSSPFHQPQCEEEMLVGSDPHQCHTSGNGGSKTPHCWGELLENPSSDLPIDQRMSTNGSLKLRTEALASKNKSGANKPSQVGNGISGHMVVQDGSLTEEETSSAQHAHWGSIKEESVGCKSLSSESTEEDDPALLAMFRAVANSRLAVRSQQKDEPDFTPTQKLAILRELYHAKPLVFLERFRTALHEEHLPCFHHLSGSYEADFYCAEVRRAGLGKTRRTRVRNKRYAALQQLIRGGEYFSDEQMRSRDPLLYEQYIGQYLSDEEMQALGSSKLEASCSLSGVLLDSYQEQVIQRRLQIQQEQEEACEEEEEEEDTDDEDKEDRASDPNGDEWVPDQGEKAFLREEFTSRMYQRFLDGKDRDFDYSEVDENPDFDNLDIVSRDEEERYFDGEDPEDADSMEAE
ncbi:coiled-coil domain-containing protein 97-like isoform X2 [Sceloporus undulatus]|nr:coiled-coil domain-containing protein 97-like isoform X2 [Sceloporus undulatus]XP_042299534.1 coiled-coil domain-containing protein 97-like isoform X2 [Sceloporus undulatus]XP_042299535.1 coiled-coil domain-containing protein 97-like isoform X2 [Sceloporus undulatus]XP_042299622.1 coiled-coil domain-containing protein 97-like isoform X2 [Sceloporus undulatus]XP_042299623.1 coiled-coil domain-containing protein 97-like isoform X2 [Sceloporus undulatus]XP_042299624.1 coiled-coil domain-contai